MDLAAPIHGSPLETLTTDVAFVAVKFPSIGSVLWLPARVTAHGRYAGGELHSVHRYSDYRLAGSRNAGIPAAAVGNTEDPWEMLDRGIALAAANQAGRIHRAAARSLAPQPGNGTGPVPSGGHLERDRGRHRRGGRTARSLAAFSGPAVRRTISSASCSSNAAISPTPRRSCARAPSFSRRMPPCISTWPRRWRRPIPRRLSTNTGSRPRWRRITPLSKPAMTSWNAL